MQSIVLCAYLLGCEFIILVDETFRLGAMINNQLDRLIEDNRLGRLRYRTFRRRLLNLTRLLKLLHEQMPYCRVAIVGIPMD